MKEKALLLKEQTETLVNGALKQIDEISTIQDMDGEEFELMKQSINIMETFLDLIIEEANLLTEINEKVKELEKRSSK